MSFRRSYRKLSLWIILFLQLFLISLLFYFGPQLSTYENYKTSGKVTFILSSDNNNRNNLTYLTTSSLIKLKYTSTRNSYKNFNTSLCFVNGTDLQSMQRSKNMNWNCECLKGWHGVDCGQPEVIWRAFLAYRKPLQIKGPRKYERRIIYVFEVNKLTKTLTEIRVNELYTVVDLFVLYESRRESYLRNHLNNGFLKQYYSKILYLNSDIKSLWFSIKSVIQNIRNEDIILTNGLNDIPNKLALNFLKFYDKWPEPISFRLRWNVYGFFWTHPQKTALKGGACTIAYLKKSLNSDVGLLQNNKTFANSRGLAIGDLNHYGGWLCEFCAEDATTIIDFLYKNTSIIVPLQKIDTTYVEELIENGVYLDGKTELLRSRRYQELYYAPDYVLQFDWKYDFLLINLYSKLDYY